MNKSGNFIVKMRFMVIALILPYLCNGYTNAFLNDFGQAFGQMGDSLSTFVDNLYTNVDSWADHIIEHAKDEDCQHICPHLKTAIHNQTFQFKPVGCQTFGLKIKEKDLPIKQMKNCCNEHQICYHKCGTVKNECDDKFNKCLVQKCEQTQKDATQLKGKGLSTKGCRTATKLLMMSFLTFGCKNFKDSQKNVCVCVGDEL